MDMLSLSLTVAVIAQGGQTCNSISLCPASAPCCTLFCLGGCNPLASYSSSSRRPNPICRPAYVSVPDNSPICCNIANTNSSGGELALMLTHNNGGTRISPTRYAYQRKITAISTQTNRWNGVVTAFITMSNIKDEIDWEFPGTNTTTGQTIFYCCGDGPDFLLDDKVVRTVYKVDTIDADGIAHYPTTPSSIQISLWRSGISTSSPYTIDWKDPGYQSAGHFYALLKSVDVQCADSMPPDPKDTSYVYGANSSALLPSVTDKHDMESKSFSIATLIRAVRDIGESIKTGSIQPWGGCRLLEFGLIRR
ncbi:hypothetical protein EI94DRAFT_1773804 [Lactarius quietus]|nr:hypothetical protein EI94DRAFT_1773804 [Lactarius quietus]